MTGKGLKPVTRFRKVFSQLFITCIMRHLNIFNFPPFPPLIETTKYVKIKRLHVGLETTKYTKYTEKALRAGLHVFRLRVLLSQFKLCIFRVAGEYGDNTNRPHYHAILFNYCPEDFKPGKDMLKLDLLKFDNDWSQLCSQLSEDYSHLFSSVSSVGSSARHSRLLSDCWGNGSVMVGDVTFESCAYVARYCLKKITGNVVVGIHLKV